MTPERWRQIEDLYHSARERGVEILTNADPELRREVEELLAQDSGSRIPNVLTSDPIMESTRTQVTPGAQLGSYKIETLLGQGGMGEVYRALDTRLNRPVAIKLLSDRLADPSARRRFQREAQLASSLNHPHIITVHDAGDFEGRQYLVTEYVDGGTLRDWSRAEPRNWRDVVELLTGVADGLAAAHTAGILHRDIKPQNVLVTRSGYGKLADFGLAKLDERIASDGDSCTLREGITRSGVMVGTIAYMSPEQVSGRHLDARSDVFSFGVLLYETLSGNRPFKGESAVDVLHSILHANPELLEGEIPFEVREVIRKALEKNPADRYQSMQQMVTDLRRLLRHGDLPSRSRTALWARAAVTAVLVLIALAIWRLWPAATGPSIRRIAVLPLQNISGDPNQEAFSDGTTEAVILNLAQVHSLSVISHTTVMHLKGSRKTIPEIGRELHADAFVTGTVQRVGGRVRVSAQLVNASTDRNIWGGRFDREGADVLQLEADVAQAIAHEVQAQITPEESKRLTRRRKVNPAAYDEYLLGRYLAWKNTGPEPYQQAIQHLQHAIEIDPDFAAAHAELATAWVMRFANGFAEARDAEAPARSEAVRAQSLDPELAETHAATAHVIMTFDWDWVNGEKELRHALELDPNSLDMCGCMAITLILLGRPQEALEWLDHAMQLNPLSSEMEALYGWALVIEHRPQDAMPHLQRARELDPHNLDTYLSLPLALEETGKPQEAIKAVQVFGPSGMLAMAYVGAGRRSEAQKLIRRLQDPWDLALAYQALGETNQALDALASAIDRRELNAVMAKTDPTFDSLRSNPRFQSLVARFKIPNPTR
jgi:serine/threonine-protein kinase